MYVAFTISEGIADRGEVPYEKWEEWVAEDYVFGPYKSVRMVYNTLEGITADGNLETIAMLVEDGGDEWDGGYWRIVKKLVHDRYEDDAGRPRSWSTPADEKLPPFSDWWTLDELWEGAEPRRIREQDKTEVRS